MDPAARLGGLSIVLPAYNEEANVAAAIEAARVAGERFAERVEVIVVDDGSRDATAERALAYAAGDARIRLLRHERNRGYGGAVKTGLKAAREPFVFFTDSDLQFDLGQIGELVARLGEAPIVVGYRANRQDPWVRKLNAWAWGRLQRVVFGIRVRDIDCAFKLFRREVVADMPMRSDGAFLSTEILARAMAAGHAIVEIPVRHYPRRAGAPTGANPGVILKAFREMAELWGDLRNPTESVKRGCR
jgi:glycosyltransferase involved in cell wall biosynthesis